MATDVKMIKFVYFVYVHPKAFHLTSYKQNLFLTFASYIEKLPEITLNKSYIHKFFQPTPISAVNFTEGFEKNMIFLLITKS